MPQATTTDSSGLSQSPAGLGDDQSRPPAERPYRSDDGVRLAAENRPLKRLQRALTQPVDIAWLVAFRVLFGTLMFIGMVRFIQSGWIDRFYGEPIFFFRYWGFSWVPVASVETIHALYIALAVLALMIALGLMYRLSIALFTLGFTYTELLDVTNYLNHYYLVTLLALLLCVMPAHRAWSLDVWLRPHLRAGQVPGWTLWLLRFQIAVVYTYAGLAKLGSDWLLYAQPMEIWLRARTETPIVGHLFDEMWAAYFLSWAGFLYDSTIVIWLSWRRTRPLAYGAVLCFHAMTHVLFNIGLFPFIMTVGALVFFSPEWPRRLWAVIARRPLMAPGERAPTGGAARQAPSSRHRTPSHKLGFALLGAYCLVQVLVPLRHYVYPGDVAWNEEGMRWSWKVMLREKHGSVTYQVHFPATGKVLHVPPRYYLNAHQEREMSGQPDLILQLAHHIADDFRARGYPAVEVRAEALVSWNGRPAAPMIDPSVDLAAMDDGLARKRWVLSEPTAPPLRKRARSVR